MRMIDADKAIEIANEFMWSHEVSDLEFVLSKTPTIEAEPVRHGRWIKDQQSKFEHRYNCSVCNYRLIGEPTNYCPNCGANMMDLED